MYKTTCVQALYNKHEEYDTSYIFSFNNKLIQFNDFYGEF
jgi:hypothetical protein